MNRLLVIGIIVGLCLVVGVAINQNAGVTCAIQDAAGNILETFKTNQGEYGCQKMIGYCDSQTCLAYAQMKFEEAGLR